MNYQTFDKGPRNQDARTVSQLTMNDKSGECKTKEKVYSRKVDGSIDFADNDPKIVKKEIKSRNIT